MFLPVREQASFRWVILTPALQDSYTFLFEPNPVWSKFYASGAEIFQYIKRVTKKYGLDECIQFSSRVTEAIWDDASAKWKIAVAQQDELSKVEADVFINVSGLLKYVFKS